MTLGMIIFLIVVFAWLFCGLMMILTINNEGTNWFGFIFLFFPPFLVIIAKFCRLF